MTSFLRLFLSGFFILVLTAMAAPSVSHGSLERAGAAGLSVYTNAWPGTGTPDGFGFTPLRLGRDQESVSEGSNFWVVRRVNVKNWVWFRTRCVRPKPPRVGQVMVPLPKIKWIKKNNINIKVVMKFKDCSPEAERSRKWHKRWLKRYLKNRPRVPTFPLPRPKKVHLKQIDS